MKKALVFIDDLSIRGGGEKVATHILDALTREGYEVYFLTLTEVDTFEEINEYYMKYPERFIKAGFLPSLQYIRAGKSKLVNIVLDHIFLCSILVKMANLYRKLRPNLIVVLANTSAQIAPFLLWRIPVLAWGLTPFIEKRALKIHNIIIYRSLVSGKLHLVLGSEKQKNFSTEKYQQYIKVLNVGFDRNVFYYMPQRKNRGSIVYVARISPEKRIELALEAAQYLKSISTSFKLTIVGGPQKEDYYRKLIAIIDENSLRGNVEIVAEDDQLTIRKYLQEAEILWNFSEGYGGIVNFEAMACGCIPIVTENFSDQVGECGYVVKNSMEAAKVTASVVNLCMSEKELLVRRCLDRARLFSSHNFVDNIRRLLREIVR